MMPNNKIREIGSWIADNEATVRDASKRFSASGSDISKSTIFRYMVKYLPNIDRVLAGRVFAVLEKNKKERAIRGGRATQLKWRGGI